MPGWSVLETVANDLFVLKSEDTPVILSISLRDADRYTISPYWPAASDRRQFIGPGELWTITLARARSPFQINLQMEKYLARLGPAYGQAVAQRDDHEKLMDLRTQRMEEMLSVLGFRKERRHLHECKVRSRGVYNLEVNDRGDVAFRTDWLEYGFALEILKEIARKHHDSALHGIDADAEREAGPDPD